MMAEQQHPGNPLNLSTEPGSPDHGGGTDPGTPTATPRQLREGTLTGSPYSESPISIQGRRVPPPRIAPSLFNSRPRQLHSAPGFTGQIFDDVRSQRLVPISDGEKPKESPSHTKSGDTDKIWEAIIEQFKWHDDELINEWQRSLDVLLIFAALFGAILTAFLVESNKLFREDYPRTTAILLAQIAQNTGTNTSALGGLADAVASLPPFESSGVAKRVNRLWFASLAFTIACAIFAMLAKQWISEYLSGVSSQMSFDPLHTSAERLRDEVRIRQFRIRGLQRWKAQYIIGGLPIVLHVALLVFAIGLIQYQWSLDHGTAIVLLVIFSLVFFLYSLSAIIPLYDPSCPYKTPLSHLLANWRRAVFLIFVPELDFDSDTSIIKRVGSGIRQAVHVQEALPENEKEEVRRHANQLDKDCLDTLKRITRNAAVAAWAEEELEAVINSTRRPHI